MSQQNLPPDAIPNHIIDLARQFNKDLDEVFEAQTLERERVAQSVFYNNVKKAQTFFLAQNLTGRPKAKEQSDFERRFGLHMCALALTQPSSLQAQAWLMDKVFDALIKDAAAPDGLAQALSGQFVDLVLGHPASLEKIFGDGYSVLNFGVLTKSWDNLTAPERDLIKNQLVGKTVTWSSAIQELALKNIIQAGPAKDALFALNISSSLARAQFDNPSTASKCIKMLEKWEKDLGQDEAIQNHLKENGFLYEKSRITLKKINLDAQSLIRDGLSPILCALDKIKVIQNYFEQAKKPTSVNKTQKEFIHVFLDLLHQKDQWLALPPHEQKDVAQKTAELMLFPSKSSFHLNTDDTNLSDCIDAHNEVVWQISHEYDNPAPDQSRVDFLTQTADALIDLVAQKLIENDFSKPFSVEKIGIFLLNCSTVKPSNVLVKPLVFVDSLHQSAQPLMKKAGLKTVDAIVQNEHTAGYVLDYWMKNEFIPGVELIAERLPAQTFSRLVIKNMIQNCKKNGLPNTAAAMEKTLIEQSLIAPKNQDCATRPSTPIKKM